MWFLEIGQCNCEKKIFFFVKISIGIFGKAVNKVIASPLPFKIGDNLKS